MVLAHGQRFLCIIEKIKNQNEKEQDHCGGNVVGESKIARGAEPIELKVKFRDVLEDPSNDDQCDDLVLLANVLRDGSWQVVDQQIDFVDKDKGERRIDRNDGVFE